MFKQQQDDLVRILLAGSSHTRLVFPFVRQFLKDRASVSILPEDAGRTDEMLQSLPGWPVEEQDLIHLYSGHRDLMPGPDGRPLVGPEKFSANLRTITKRILERTSAKVVFSNVPPVSKEFLTIDPDWNARISLYNKIIYEVASDAGFPVHDFWTFLSSYGGGETKYIDGLHFTRRVYRDFAKALALYLIGQVK